MKNYKNKKVLVIGLGISGKAASKFLLAHEALVHGVDRNYQTIVPEQPGMTIGSDSELLDVGIFDLVVLSPGIPQTHPLVQAALKSGIEVIGEIELGCRNRKNTILGITGTNGKTTVTLLVTHVLNQCGKQAHALGNIGKPFTQEVLNINSSDIIVLELSSYQLETMSQRVLDAGVILNITPDHLDRYGSMEAYAAAKCRMRLCLKPDGKLFVEENMQNVYGHFLEKSQIQTYGYLPACSVYTNLKSVFMHGHEVFVLPEILQGRKSHDLENMMAAYALCACSGVTGKQFIEAYLTFRKPAHRIQFVLEHRGVKYYDDSKGTNIDAVIRAVQSIEGQIILIAGGVDKGSPYTPWLKEFRNKVKWIYAIGEASSRIKEQLLGEIPVEIITDLEQAVGLAASRAKRGDVVLLSPGCSSFDMFRDYVHRGEVYQEAVRRIKRVRGE